MNKSKKILLSVNAAVIAAVFVLNWFYQANGFDYRLKCIASGVFALLGLFNLGSALWGKAKNRRLYIAMAAGLFLAFLGDVLINLDFIAGAATFALGHICFVVAYCLEERLRLLDYILWGVLFAGAAAFLFSPLLDFSVPVYRAVCVAYALIISAMLAKAVGNLVRRRTPVCAPVALASLLFFFSDLMLVLDWFVGKWEWTDNACMATYYPALCLLAFSMCLRLLRKDGEERRAE
jgi:uncharacterized membrane protein YhhN